MRHRVAERLELTVDGGQRSRPLLNQLFELSAIPPQLLLRLVELHEHGHLGPHDGGDHWGEDEVDRSEIVAPAHVDLGVVERGDKDDRGHLRSRSLTNQSGGLEAVHPGIRTSSRMTAKSCFRSWRRASGPEAASTTF